MLVLAGSLAEAEACCPGPGLRLACAGAPAQPPSDGEPQLLTALLRLLTCKSWVTTGPLLTDL